MMRIYKKAILPRGFLASGLSAGIKKSGKPDLALFYSQVTAKAACFFTANKIEAAPVKICKEYLKKKSAFHAIIANSGNANSFTGNKGLGDARRMTVFAADALGIRKESVLVASTGIIGRRMNIIKVKNAMPRLVGGLSRRGIDSAKRAIMTTDSLSKEATVDFTIGRKKIVICGVAKGAGMIAPKLATMLAFIFTDAVITQPALEKALKIAVGESFNCITVDGCMSTNDTVAILANGTCGNMQISEKKYFTLFVEGLKTVCLGLAKMIVKDGEGATKIIRIEVAGARTKEQARQAALSIANSSLFKTAVYGGNPNFGRILAAVGSSGVAVDEKRIKVKLGPLNKREVDVRVWLNTGREKATVYTCDLTPEYIKINAEYN